MSLKNQLRVMVVDDMSTSRALITQALDVIGIANYAVENDGQNALRTLATSPVHLVLSDMNMPNMDGLQLLEALRRSPATAKVGFILVTGSPTPEVIQKGQTLGLNNMIKKPFSAAQMKQCIERVVGRL